MFDAKKRPMMITGNFISFPISVFVSEIVKDNIIYFYFYALEQQLKKQ
jgi:hypothetical protein